MARSYLLLFILLFSYIPNEAMHISRVDDNTVQLTNEDGSVSTNINISSYSNNSSSGSSSEEDPQPVNIYIYEAPPAPSNVRKYVAWVTVGGAITVSTITGIVSLVQHFTS